MKKVEGDQRGYQVWDYQVETGVEGNKIDDDGEVVAFLMDDFE